MKLNERNYLNKENSSDSDLSSSDEEIDTSNMTKHELKRHQ
jgi:hypothetical protein